MPSRPKISAWIMLVFMIQTSAVQPVHSHSEKGSATLSGKVINKKTGETLADANLWLKVAGVGHSSDKKGEFSFQGLSSGLDTLVVRYMGYESQKLPVVLKNNISLSMTIALAPIVIPMEEINVVSSRISMVTRLIALDPSSRHLKAQELERIPSVGFTDVYRALQKLPGINAINEASPQIHIRGGDSNQNLVLLDGATVYYPFHFLGISSSFNTDALEDVDLSLGGFSAYFGGRLSSVLSMKSKYPSDRFKTSINVQLIGADLTSSGKIGKKIGYLFSGRASYLDVTNRLGLTEIPYNFQDGLFKLGFTPSPRHHMQLTFFGNRDHLNNDEKSFSYLHSSVNNSRARYDIIDRDKILWSNYLSSFQWDFVPNRAFSFHLTAYRSAYGNFYRKEKLAKFPDGLNEKFWKDRRMVAEEIKMSNRQNQSNVENNFTDHSVKAFVKWQPYSRLMFVAGGEASWFSAKYFWDNLQHNSIDRYIFLFFDYAPVENFSYSKAFQNQNGFIENTFSISDSLSVRTGLRMSRWSYLDKIIFEPRLSLRYSRPGWHTSVAVGRYSQGIATSLEDGLVGFLELYFPVDGTQHVEMADHYFVEISKQFSPTSCISIAAYYKKFSGLLKSVPDPQRFIRADGTAKGVEFSLQMQFKNWDISLSYTWSHSRRKYDALAYDTNFDQRHRIQLSGRRSFLNGWDFSLYWVFHSSQPYNPGVYHSYIPFFYSNQPPYNNYKELQYLPYEMDISRDKIRYPYYHRLDISVSRTIRRGRMIWLPYVSVYNAYMMNNVLYYRTAGRFTYDSKGGSYKNPHIERDPFILPIIPTIGLKIQF